MDKITTQQLVDEMMDIVTEDGSIIEAMKERHPEVPEHQWDRVFYLAEPKLRRLAEEHMQHSEELLRGIPAAVNDNEARVKAEGEPEA